MTLKYPEFIDGSTDYMMFEFGEYKSSTQQPAQGESRTAYSLIQPFTKIGEVVALNMPSDIGTSFTGAWSGKNTTSLAQAALGQVAGISGFLNTGDFKKIADQTAILKNPGESIGNTLKAFGDDGIRYLAQSFSSLPGLGANLSENDILQLTSGTILNPNTELLYGGNSLRTHSYTFKMIPQSKNEAQAILDIVKRFREACLPKTKSAIFGTEGRNFIAIPEICQVKFMRGNGKGENEFLPKYKPSGITSVNISYVTDGSYMSFNDGKPTGIQLTVSLTELKLVFRDDLEAGRAR